MAATTLYLNDQSWRRVDGVAVLTDAALVNKVVELGIARRTP